MPLSLAQKLRIKEGSSLLTIDAPENFEEQVKPPENVSVSSKAKSFDQIHWFVTTKAKMEKELDKVLKLLKEDIVCWIYYPKGTSKIQTDLTRDKGWEELMKHKELQWLSLISFDETWSAFGMRRINDADKKKESKPNKREIFNYADSQTKTVRLPEDLSEALKQDKKAEKFFNSLSFTNKKEYVEWIITAKREETRRERVNGAVERLNNGWKNPRNV